MAQIARPFTGIRFLIIENELMQAALLEVMLSEMGGDVMGVAFDYEQASRAIKYDFFDCAVLDVNLNGTLSFPLADILKTRNIPFVFCTAFDEGIGAYPHASEISWIDKPVQAEELRSCVRSALDASPPHAHRR